MKTYKRLFTLSLCLCAALVLLSIQADAAVPNDLNLAVTLAGDSAYKYYDGNDTDSLSVSSMSNGTGSYNGGTITVTNSGSSSTIHLKESKNFKNAEYILVPFTMSVNVPAYTAYTIDTKIQLSMNRNAKGSSWYVFEWTDNTNNAAYGKSFSTKMDLTTTDGFMYRAYGNARTYTPAESGKLIFDNRTGDTAKAITKQYAIFVGNSRSASLLKSYHHQLETSLTLTPTSVTATKSITYYNGENLVGSQQYDSESKALFSTVPKKTGYVFIGWKDSDGNTYQPGATYTGNTGLKLTAQWSKGTSTVTFDANEGTVDIESKGVCIDSAYGELPAPERDYYTFLGWYTDANGGSRVTESTTVTTAANHTLYAHWMQKTAYVKFDSNGGSPSSSVTMNAGKTLRDIPDFDRQPTRNNYTFAGWYTEKDEGTQVTGETIISNSVTYYAHWTGKQSTVTLNYNNSDTPDSTMNVSYGGTYSGLTDPMRTGYTFDGWYTAATGGSKVTSSTTVTETENHILYARWTRNTATVRFMDGSTTVASRTVDTGDALGTPPDAPTKTGYAFGGWYAGGTKADASAAVSTDITYYARWTAETYDVTFDANGGAAGESTSIVTYGGKYTLPADPTRTGYTFKGWYTAASGGTQVTSDTTVTRAENHTLYARWERIVYTVTFKNDTATVETRKVNAGEKLGALPTAAKAGYTFKGWYTSENDKSKVKDTDSVSASVTYYAQWTANTYTVTFNPNGGTVTDDTKTLTYGGTLGTLPTPTRTGYTFAGWYTAASGGTKVTTASTVPSADTTYYAHWTANTYTVTFNANGGTLSGNSSVTVAYGSTYGALPTAAQTDQNFVGWYTEDSGGTQVTSAAVMTRTEDHTLYARYAARHTHAVAPDGAAVEFNTVLTAEMIDGWDKGYDSNENAKKMPGGNYYLTGDVTTDKCIMVAPDATVNICFNGYTITSTYNGGTPNSALSVGDRATLNICDCRGGGGMSNICTYIMGVGGTNCKTNLYGGTFTAKNIGLILQNSASLLVNGATIKSGGDGLYVGKATVNIDSGTVTSSGSYAIKAETGTVTINGGTVSSTGTASQNVAIYAGASSNVTINGGTVTSSGYDTVSCKTPDFTVTGGTITNTGKWTRAISATYDSAHITLSGSPSIGRILVDSDTGKITAGENLSGTYQISLNAPADVTETAPVTLTTGSSKDHTANFVLVESNAKGCALRDVVVNGEHTVQIYRSHKHDGVEWECEAVPSNGQLTGGRHYILTDSSSAALTVRQGESADLCLNGKSLNNQITVNGTLNLYDTGVGVVKNDSGSAIVVGEKGTLNYYGGNLTGGSGNYVPVYVNTGGIVNLYATPTISTSCDYEIRGNSPGFLHICKALTQPTKALRVNFGDDVSVNITNHKQVVVTTGWSAYMSGKTPTDYFAPRANRTAKIDTNENGELMLRLLRVTLDGRTYYPAYSGGKIADFPAQPVQPGYVWQGYCTAESGGEKKEIGTSTVFTEDLTLYSRWTVCDHTGYTGSKTTTLATCTAAGSEKFACSVCGLAVENVIPALGHDYDNSGWTVDETRGTHYHECTICKARVDEAEHTWNEGTTIAATCTGEGSVKYTCTDCTATKTETLPALGHDYGSEWLEDETNHWHECSRDGCGVTADSGAHSWDAGVVTTPATTNSEGTKTFTCGVCGKTKTETIGKLTPPAPVKYTVTYQLDEYTNGTAPTQAAAAEGENFSLPSTGLTRTGYTFAGWALLDETDVAGNDTLTGTYTMPDRDVTFVVRWTRLNSYNLESGDTVVLEDGTVIERDSDGGAVTIKQGGSDAADTTITLPEDGHNATLEKNGTTNKIAVPAGSTVETGATTITISGGEGKVETSGAVEAPASSSVADANGNTVTITSGTGRIDTDGTVSFPNGGSVTVKHGEKKTAVTVPAGGEGVTVTKNGTPLVDDGNGGVTIVSGDGTTTTVTLPDNADGNAGIDENENGVSVPAGSTITTTKTVEGKTTTTTTTISEGAGDVTTDGKVTLPEGGKIITKDSEGNTTESTVAAGKTVEPHTHVWSNAWSSNGTHHWHKCDVENCPVTLDSEKSDYDAHTNETGSGDCTKEEKCIVCQAITKAAEASHKWSDWKSDGDGKHTRTCTVEGCNVTETADCSGGSATCRAKAVCATCNCEYGDFAAHEFNDSTWGYRSADGHAHLCRTAGCTMHDEIIAHTSGGPATETAPETCDTCGYTLSITPPQHVHDPRVIPAVPATCEHDGLTEGSECSVCHEMIKGQTTIPALGHDWGSYVVTTPATTENEGVETRICLRDSSHQQTRAIPKLPTRTYGVSGAVKDSNDALLSGVTVKLVLGDRQIASTTTDVSGAYNFDNIAPGIYNLVTVRNEDSVTMTVKVEVASKNVEVGTITMPFGKTSSVVEVKSETAEENVEAVVGNLEKIFSEDTAKTVYTADDREKVNAGGSVEIKLTVARKDEGTASEKITQALQNSGSVGLCLELDVEKTVTSGDETETTKISNTGVLLETTIRLPEKLQGKSSYTVYRLHDDEVDTLTTTSHNTDGEYIEVSTDKSSITIHAKYYSEYVIAYHENRGEEDSSGSDSEEGGSSGSSHGSGRGGGSYTPTYSLTVEDSANGSVTADRKSASKGDTVTLTVKADAGYLLKTLVVSDKDGEEMKLTDKGDGKYSFTMPGGKVTVSAVFAEDHGYERGYASCPKDATCPIEPYADAVNTAWYHDGVHFCLENGLMVGLSGGRFAPSGDVTRAQVVTILWRLEGKPVVNYAMQFEDAATGEWFTEAVRWAASSGIVTGYSDKAFGPNDAITREQFAAILYRYSQFKGCDVSVGEDRNILDFDDTQSISTYAVPAIQWACGSGMISGVNAFTLDPTGVTSRAQAATMFMRYCTAIVK